MTELSPTAMIADDEPLLRSSLKRMLAAAWPQLQIVAEARNGREAVEYYQQHRPQVCFLDVHMPGVSGVEAARQIGREAQLVFVTAYSEYALDAFEHGALDYLVKPVEAERLADTVARLRQRLSERQQGLHSEALLDQLAERLSAKRKPAPLRWLRASVGNVLRMIAVEDIDYLRSDEKYTRIAWREADQSPAQALIRTPLKELIEQLDGERFVQVHRSVVVNLHAIDKVLRNDNETATLVLKGDGERLPVSRSYVGLFRQM